MKKKSDEIITIDTLKKKVTLYTKKDWPLIEKAFKYAESLHEGQKRKSFFPTFLTACRAW